MRARIACDTCRTYLPCNLLFNSLLFEKLVSRDSQLLYYVQTHPWYTASVICRNNTALEPECHTALESQWHHCTGIALTPLHWNRRDTTALEPQWHHCIGTTVTPLHWNHSDTTALEPQWRHCTGTIVTPLHWNRSDDTALEPQWRHCTGTAVQLGADRESFLHCCLFGMHEMKLFTTGSMLFCMQNLSHHGN